jgi:predicted MPP superfamily phosphohydrolase
MQPPYQRPHTADDVTTVVIILTQALIGLFLWKDFRPRVSKQVFRATATVMSILWFIVAGSIWLNAFDEGFRRYSIPSRLCSLWMAAANLWAIPAAAAVFAYLLYKFVASRPRIVHATEHNPQRRTLLRAAGTAAVAAPFVATGIGALIERTNFQIREVDFPIRGLHPDMDGFRIAQVSDLHVSPYLSVREAGRAIDMANELKPHLAIVTGDLISNFGDPLDGAIAQIARLRADTGVLGCLGNHEIYAECEDYATEESARRGVKFLRSESRIVRWGNASLNVAGVDYQSFYWKHGRYLRGAENLVEPGMPNLLLSHNPDVFPVAVEKGFDAMLGGHTHGGQVTMEILKQDLNFARFYTRYILGLYRLKDASCYVTAGVGTIGMPVRIGVPPEITLLRLRRA